MTDKPERGAVFEGRLCTRCGSTERLVSTGRCRYCNKMWLRRNMASQEERTKRRNTPCDICGDNMDQPCYDENPETGVSRGWLCHHCNRGLGMFRDQPRLLALAIEYLQSH